ncbi:MAG: CRISPR-associated protein Cas4 [Caldilineaceae bacterium]|nr:CRISPR-associated protein Cas4 [Caldilineaceae bacterium]MDE0337907.1 CRISPR-associated protein Cas4 [Caldilineaceae bacterium]
MIPSLPLALAFALLLALLGGVLLWLGRRQRESSGLPAGTVLYRDTGDWQETERPLRSRRYGLVGRPDYLVQMRDGGRRFVVPVEVKSRARPARPYDSHILQLAAYCLLVEDNFDAAPPYGLLRYADATLQIPFTDELRGRVLETAAAIRASRRAGEVRRSHAEPGRCAACGYRSACGSEALS